MKRPDTTLIFEIVRAKLGLAIRLSVTILLLISLLLIIPGLIRAQTGGGYDLSWHTIDSGGYTFSAGGNYQLGGTIGQPDAGALSASTYNLVGGFWGGDAYIPTIRIYLPLVLRNFGGQ